MRLVTAGNRTWVESRPGGGRRGRGAAAAGAEAHSDLLHKRGSGAHAPLPGAELALASGSLFSAHPLLLLREIPHVPLAQAGPGGARGCLCESSGGPGPGPCPRRLRGLDKECASGSMVSAEAAAVGRPARFDVRGGALKLAGRLFRGALRAGAEGKLRARRPALRGVWPGGPAHEASESPSPTRGPGYRGVRSGRLLQVASGSEAETGSSPSGVESPWVWMSRGVRLHASAFGRWDERVAAPPLALPAPSYFFPLSSPPPNRGSALRCPERWWRLSLSAGRAGVRGARAPRVPPRRPFCGEAETPRVAISGLGGCFPCLFYGNLCEA